MRWVAKDCASYVVSLAREFEGSLGVIAVFENAARLGNLGREVVVYLTWSGAGLKGGAMPPQASPPEFFNPGLASMLRPPGARIESESVGSSPLRFAQGLANLDKYRCSTYASRFRSRIFPMCSLSLQHLRVGTLLIIQCMAFRSEGVPAELSPKVFGTTLASPDFALATADLWPAARCEVIEVEEPRFRLFVARCRDRRGVRLNRPQRSRFCPAAIPTPYCPETGAEPARRGLQIHPSALRGAAAGRPGRF